MDNQQEILLNQYQNIKSVNVDSHVKFELDNNLSETNEYDVKNVINATEVFDNERETNQIYRIYGKIEYMSLLNYLKNEYLKFEDFFLPQPSGNSKNILNSFDFYLIRPATGYTQIIINAGDIIDEKFDNWVTSTPSNYPLGWIVNVTTNSYLEQTIINQAKFVLSNGPINLITLSKNIASAYGDLVFKTKVDINSSFVIGTDMLTVSFWSGTNILYSYDTLSTGIGSKEYNFYVSPSNPLTKIMIVGNSNGKTMYMDYFQLYNKISVISNSSNYLRTFKIIATPNDFELYPIGFANNVYNEQAYAFNFNVDIDVSDYYDELTNEFKFPTTELFLYAQYKQSTYTNESMFGIKWSNNGTQSRIPITNNILNIGDYVETSHKEKICDIIEYSKPEFYQAQITSQQFYINTPYIENGQLVNLVWKYNPFIPIRLRYLSDNIYEANTGSTSYDLVQSIPSYATKLDNNGNYVWRIVMQEGYKDPLSGIGTDYPFINGKRYLFSSIIFDIIPDLDDSYTYRAFTDIWYTRNVIKTNITPTGDINNIGKPCH